MPSVRVRQVRVGFFLPDLAIGGLQRAALLLCRHWPGEHPLLLVRDASGPLVDEVGGLPLVDLGMARAGPAATLRTPSRLLREARRHRLDVLVSFSSAPSVAVTRRFL